MKASKIADLQCEVSPDCLECPLSQCRFDDQVWFQEGLRLAAYESMAEMKGRGSSVAAIGRAHGCNERTVMLGIRRLSENRMAQQDMAVFRRIAEQVCDGDGAL